MIGFLFHLAKPWNGLRHCFVIGTNEVDCMLQFAQGRWCTEEPLNKLAARITWYSRTEADWQRFRDLPLVELCSACNKNRAA